MLMRPPNKHACVAHAPTIRCHRNATEYANFLWIAANFDVAGVNSEMSENPKVIT